MSEYPPSGKTTRLMEEAVALLADLPEGAYVYITGPHTEWLKALAMEFKDSGLVGVKFLTINEIINGSLRDKRGVLLIDDEEDLSLKQMDVLYLESTILKKE